MNIDNLLSRRELLKDLGLAGTLSSPRLQWWLRTAH